MNQNIVIGVEGDVGSGKTSMCKELVNLIPNCVFADAGLIARAIVMGVKKSPLALPTIIKMLMGKSVDSIELMKKLKIEFKIKDKQTLIYIKGKKVEEKNIQTEKNSTGVSKYTSKVNTDSLYEFARNIINKYRKKYNVIVSARDLVRIYPDMTAHVFVTASLIERVNRRYKQFQGKFTKAEIEENILKRDRMHEKAGYNKTYEKTVKVDITDCKNPKESAEKVLHAIKLPQQMVIKQ